MTLPPTTPQSNLLPSRSLVHFKDIAYAAVVRLEEEYRLAVYFDIYEIAGETSDGVMLYGENAVDHVEDAEIYLSGSVKWDGCSNWNFDEQDRGTMLHACSRRHLTNMGEVMARCWDIASGMIERFCGHAE